MSYIGSNIFLIALDTNLDVLTTLEIRLVLHNDIEPLRYLLAVAQSQHVSFTKPLNLNTP